MPSASRRNSLFKGHQAMIGHGHSRHYRRSFELIGMFSPERLDLRCDDHTAVGLIGIALKIVDVILLRRVEAFERLDLSHDRIVPNLGGVRSPRSPSMRFPFGQANGKG